MPEHHDTVIVGAGQAGLAMSAVLQRHGREHVVLERWGVGDRWRTERWDSLRFQFPNWSLQLPGYRYTGGDPDGFAHYTEIVRLIEDYAASTRAPVREHTEVVGVQQDATGTGFVVSVAGDSLHARRVVLATGPFQRPFIPPMSQDIWPSVLQTDPTRYRCPEQLPAGAVLIVGSGASGCQIADELSAAGRTVFLSVSGHRRIPRRFRGRDVYWWLEQMGRLAQTIDSFPGRRWPPSIVVTGVNGGYDINVRQLATDGVRVVGRVAGASGRSQAIDANANQILDEADAAYAGFMSAAREFATQVAGEELADDQPVDWTGPAVPVSEVDSLDLAREHIGTIIWATGYAYDLGWVKAPVLDNAGRPVQRRGVTQEPGLYFLGLHWMHTIKSGLLSGVGNDAEYLTDHIAAMHRPERRRR
jgi:putative flavoprotein involved in K+ transport